MFFTFLSRAPRRGTYAAVRTAWPLVLCGALAACSMGPPYIRPPAPGIGTYTAQPLPRVITVPGTAAGSQRLAYGARVGSHWWERLGSPALNRLMAEALADNPDLAAARHTLAQTRYELTAVEGIFYPQISLNAGAERTRSSGASSGGIAGPNLYDLYTGQLDVTYYPDVFGLNRLVARSAQARVDIAREQLRAARLVIEGDVANTVIAIAALRAQIKATEESIDGERAILDLVHKQYAAGAVSQLQVATQESELATTQAQLPSLQLARDRARHLLATYVGEFPAQAHGVVIPRLTALQLPARVPVSLPARLVRARPDVRAAEAQLRAANAQVGEADARLYPNLQLSASFGQQTNGAGAFFDPASRIWSLVAAAAAPIFEGGTLRAQKHAAEEAYRAVFANYRSTVLTAFRDVADALRALQRDAAVLQARARALRAARTAFGLARRQYQAGAIDYLSLLTSEVQYQTARSAEIGARAQRYADTVGLYVALGGGVVDPRPNAAATQEK